MIVLDDITELEVEDLDLFNNYKTWDKVDIYDTNCMSYVFNAQTWLQPDERKDTNEIIDDIIYEGIVEDTEENRRYLYTALKVEGWSELHYFDLIVKRLLDCFPDLRIIDDFDELKENEYGISYCTKESDFHFIKYEDGKYSHKQGDNEVEELENCDDSFERTDDYVFNLLGYNGHLARFAMKKGNVRFNAIV